MKIKAIRVAEVGCFSAPVAVEGLSGKLDVLSGPNELGKSTLLKALTTVFAEKYTTTSTPLKNRLVPYAGGAPLIEVDFELGGEAWQIRKRFFTGKFAELKRVSKNEIMRNRDAEEALELLLAEHGGGRLGLFWVKQGAGFEPLGAGEAETSLRAALEHEVAIVAGGTSVRAVHTNVRKRLEELRTEARGQPKGAYRDAKNEEERLIRELSEAAKAREMADLRLEGLGRARAELTALTDAEKAETRTRAAMEARASFDAAEAAQRKLKEAEAAWSHLDAVHALSVSNHQELARRLAEHAELTQALAADAPVLMNAQVQRDQAATGVAQARAAGLSAEQAEAEERSAHDLAVSRERDRKELKRVQRERAKLEEKVSEVRRLATAVEQGRKVLAGNPLDDAMLQRIEAADAEVNRLEAEVAAALPVIAIEYQHQARGSIRLDGHALHGDARMFLRPYSVLDIAGIGRISITAGGAETTGETATNLAALMTTLADLLVMAEVADVATARHRHKERASAERRLNEAEVRLSALAPEGVPALEAELTEARRRSTEIVDDGSFGDLIDLTLLAERLASSLAARRSAAVSVNRAVDAERAAGEHYQVVRARQDERSRRLAGLVAELPPTAERAARVAQLADAERAAAAAAREAVLVRHALRETTPPAEQVADLQRLVLTMEQAEDDAVARIGTIEKEIAGHEAALGRDLDDGIEERLAELADRAALAKQKVEEFEREIAALALLDTRLLEAEKHTMERYVIPASAALAPYLTTVFPAAELAMGKGFAPEGLVRYGRMEPVSVLSDGTREQISILARLGFASIEADAGHPFPVILDDALVYADDARIARMFDSLTSAAQRHQVIVLTCRERSFAGMGGHRLRLASWHQALAA
jgi:energy-coupling factor transporter ATP-binding protein EcfA2